MGWISRVLKGDSSVVQHAQALADKESEAKFDAIDVDDLPGIFAELTGTSYTPIVGTPPKMDRKIALSVPAVSRSRDRIAGTIGTLPLDLIHDASKETRPSSLLEQPEMGLARIITITRTVADLMFENFALWLVKERDGYGFPTYVERIDTYRVDRNSRTGVIKVDGKEVPNIDVIMFVGPAESGALERGARPIRMAVLLDDLARRFAENPQAREYFVPAEGADPADDDTVKAVLNDWATARRSGVTGYVGGGLELKQGQLINPRDLQLADARQHAVLEIARLFGIDPDDLGVSVTSRTYQNLEQSRREFITNTLQPFISAVEQRLSLNDVCPRGTYVRFNLAAFLRADTTSRYAAYTSALAGGFLTVDEVRELEDRQPLAKAEEATVTQSAGTVAAGKFSDTEVVTFDAPAAQAMFKVDLDKRTITGLAVPYGQAAQSGGRLWQFSKGSLKYDDVSRVKFLDGHDWSKPIGRAIKLEETPAGLVATFKVIATPAGDEALLMASDNVKDGLSVGIALGGQYEERAGVTHALSAPLAEISLTPCPAFDNARVTAVAASKQTKENTVADKVETPATEPVAPQFTADQIAALTALIKPAEETPKPEPQAVPTFQVKEELPYRFDGTRGEHEFSSDLFAAARSNDGEAKARVDKFMQAAFDITTSNVASVNPSRQRPDLFVDQLGYVLPVWDAISKGTLPDSTPFIVPKYNASSGLVADHTQGTEPTEGSYSTTSQTITPGAISGKVEITREVVDAGGNPQVSGLIWNQVVRDYAEALEAKAVALLDGLTPTAIALTTAAADDVLAGQIEAALAALHFVRGGDRFDKLVLQEDLYKAIVAARDADGRVLYPVLGAVNSNGQTAADFGSVRIGGKTGLPAWALGASGTVSESSYLFSSDDVHGWATAPQQLRFEYQVATVTFGVWGYQATANTRLAGVREITYDPAA